jgi:undecaprenyl diphosphate synthase
MGNAQLPQLLYFTEQQILDVSKEKIPEHVAIILDGNRRFAKQRNLPVIQGHAAGASRILDVVKSAKELGIRCLTLFVFSTENWNRSPLEVIALMQLIESFILENIPEMLEHGIQFNTIGAVERLPASLQKAIQKAKSETAHCTGIKTFFALNYGGRDEMVRACKKILADYRDQRLNLDELNERKISSYLDTAELPDPDLLIRTAGEKRISNFLLWQLSYAELYITQTLWPEFTPQDLLSAITEFQSRERRNGV